MVAVFVSYAREDSEFAQRFCADLDRPGIEPWLDLDRLKPGRWEPALTDALESSRYVLPLLSRRSLDSDEPGYVQTEWDIALSADKLIVPILVEAIPERLRSSPWFKRMSDYQWYDVAADYEANLRKLLRALLADDAGGSFRETFSCDGPDREGWDLGDWSLSDEDATGRRSQSLHAKASLAAFGKSAAPSGASIAVA